MKTEEKKTWITIDKEIKFNCKNKKLIGVSGTRKDYRDGTLIVWRIYDTKYNYIDSMDNGIGKMYSMNWGEVQSFEELVNIWEKRYVIENFRTGGSKLSNSYTIETYGINSKEQFDKLMTDLTFLLNKDCVVHYNDDGGVGNFYKRGKKYILVHHRWGTTQKEEGTIKDIGEVLRDFFQIGMSLMEDW